MICFHEHAFKELYPQENRKSVKQLIYKELYLRLRQKFFVLHYFCFNALGEKPWQFI